MAAPTEITLTIDLDSHLAKFMGFDNDGEPVQEPTSLEDVIIMLAARDVAQAAMGVTSRDWMNDLRHYAVQVRDRVLAEKFEPMLEEAITRSFQPTNDFGVPRGEPTTLHEVIVKQAEAFLNRQTPDRYPSDKRQTPLERLIADQVSAAMTRELKATIDAAKAEVTAAVKAKGAEVLAKTITDMAAGR